MALEILNLDRSYPIVDPNHATNTAGTIRYITAEDPITLEVMNRLQGDIANRIFLVEDKVNEVIEEVTSDPTNTSFDNSPYALIDGSHPFVSPQGGVAPVQEDDLTTKGYVDGELTPFQELLDTNTLAIQEIEQTMPKIISSSWTEHTWTPGVRQQVDFTLSPSGSDFSDLIAVQLLERLDIAQVTEANPSPDPVYVYRSLGNSVYGFGITDFWVSEDSQLHVVIPNTAEFPTDMAGDHLLLSSPRDRYLKAVALIGSPSADLASGVTYKTGKVAVPNGANTVDVTFPQAFIATPNRVELTLFVPSGEAVLNSVVESDSLSSLGFTVNLSGTTAATGYEVQWAAFL